ncbi:MAG TPA: hypothetical protein VET90_02800 [Candidatus Binatus sp.]|nr:hypothetical protein [Candidatus Binatus sp.]
MAGIVLALSLGGCSALIGPTPGPSPLDFPGFADQLTLQGLTIQQPISGDAGCDDPTLVPTAIGFELSGLGVTKPIHARVYLFAGRAAYDRRRAQVDTCTAAWTTDPADVEFINAPPFVLVVQGPLPPAFKAALVRALTISATGTD